MTANLRRRAYRRWEEDSRIWREFYCASLIAIGPIVPRSELRYEAANLADHAYTEYRERFPRSAAALEPDTDLDDGSTSNTKEGVQ